MIKIKKDFNLKIVSLSVTLVFLFANLTYGIEVPGRPYLRVPVLGNSEKGIDRTKDALAVIAHPGGSSDFSGLLGQIIKEAESDLEQFYVSSGLSESQAKEMAEDFSGNALASIMRREQEDNFSIPYLKEDFPTLSELIHDLSGKPLLEQREVFKKYAKEIVGALLLFEIPACLKKQWTGERASEEYGNRVTLSDRLGAKKLAKVLQGGKTRPAEKPAASLETEIAVVPMSPIDSHIYLNEATVTGVTYVASDGDIKVAETRNSDGTYPVFSFEGEIKPVRDRYYDPAPLKDREGILASKVYRVRELVGENEGSAPKPIEKLIEMVKLGNPLALIALEIKGAMFSTLDIREENAKAELISLIRAGKVVTYEQALRYLEEKSRNGELGLYACADLLAIFNNLVKENLTDDRVKNVSYIEIEGEDETLHKIEIIQSEKFFTAIELLEIIQLVRGLPTNIRACIGAIERVINSSLEGTLATAVPEDHKIFIPDAFYSFSYGNGIVVKVHNESNRKEIFVHEALELYVTGNSEALINGKISELHRIAKQFSNLPLTYLRQVLLGFKKDLETAVFSRWIKTNGYVVDRAAFYKHLSQSEDEDEKYIFSWIETINKNEYISDDIKQELIETFELMDMFISCWSYAKIWMMNGYGASPRSINPSEDLVEACLLFLLDGGMYRQKAALACKLQNDTTPLISYLVLKNGPFKGKEYGRDPEGEGVYISYMGDSAEKSRVYHVQGTMRYSREKTDKVNLYAFVPINKIDLIGSEKTINLHATIDIAASNLSREVLSKL